MGNWCTVTIVGSIDPKDANAAVDFVETEKDLSRFHCLCYCGPSLCGLGRWVPREGGVISVVGNLSERDYGPEAVAEVLRQMVAVAPSLDLRVHCGGDYESTVCESTVTVADGVVVIGPPEVATVGDGLSEISMVRFGEFLTGGAS
jgi:hypothetical protein